jgi:hypothetical protein
VENVAGVGTPDVNTTRGWIELKVISRWPSDPARPLLVPEFTPQQRAWIARRRNRGGSVWVLIRVANDWLLFDGMVASRRLGMMNKEDCRKTALRAWMGALNERELLDFLLHAN